MASQWGRQTPKASPASVLASLRRERMKAGPRSAELEHGMVRTGLSGSHSPNGSPTGGGGSSGSGSGAGGGPAPGSPSAFVLPTSRGATTSNPLADIVLETWCSAVVDGLKTALWSNFIVSFVACVLILAALESTSPYDLEFIPNDPAISHPEKSTSIPFSIIMGVGLIPAFVMLVCEVLRRGVDAFLPPTKAQRIATLLQLWMATAESMLFASTATEALKKAFGGLRPDFQAKCLGIAYPNVAPADATTCTSSANESRVSFPSGHTSVSSAYSTMLALYIGYRLVLRLNSTSSRFRAELFSALTIFCAVPFVFPAFVGTTRFHENRHTLVDVFAGFFVGFVSACVCFARAVVLINKITAISALEQQPDSRIGQRSPPSNHSSPNPLVQYGLTRTTKVRSPKQHRRQITR